MPVVNITMFSGRTSVEKTDICRTIQQIIKDTFHITHDNFHHRVNEFSDHDLLIPAASSRNYISIEFDFLPKRSVNEKRELYINIETGLKRFGINTEDILMILREPELENWYIRGKSGEEIKSPV